MTQTKKKTLLLTLAAVFLAVLSALLLFIIAPQRPAKADGEEVKENTVIEKTDEEKEIAAEKTLAEEIKYWQDLLNDKKPLKIASRPSKNSVDLDYSSCERLASDPSKFGGLVLVINGDGGRVFRASCSLGQFSFGMADMNALYFEYYNEGESQVIAIPQISEEDKAELPVQENETVLYAFYIPHSIEVDGSIIDLDNATFSIAGVSVGYCFYSEPAETPAETPNTNSNNTNANNNPFDFGDWLKDAGNNISAWLGDYAGVATTGSTVLIVGAVIIAVMLLKKRR